MALFDTRIEQTRRKLDDVQERQERCRIVEQELLAARQRLEKDCAKARAYQELREQLQLGRRQELVLAYEAAQAERRRLQQRHQDLGDQDTRDSQALEEQETTLQEAATKLKTLQDNVKALGEDQLLGVQAELAGLDPQNRELERQAAQHQQEGERLQAVRHDLQARRGQIQSESESLRLSADPSGLAQAEQDCRDAEAAVERSRRQLGEVAGRSGTWIEEQRQRSSRRQQLQASLAPLQEERQQLKERLRQADERRLDLEQERDQDGAEDHKVQTLLAQLEQEWQALLNTIRTGQEQLQQLAESLAIQQRTRTRLAQEQTRLERAIGRAGLLEI